jgi:hypothetical protein
MRSLPPECNEWRNYKAVVCNVQRWVKKYSWWRAKWSAICREWSCSMCWQKIYEWQCSTISDLSCEFSQISCTAACEIITVRLSYHKFCANRVSKILMGARTTRNGFGFIFFRAIQQRWRWISQLHCTSNRWWKGLNKCQPEIWWQLFLGTGKECWWRYSCNEGPH